MNERSPGTGANAPRRPGHLPPGAIAATALAATLAAPAANTSRARARVMPPMATTGRRVNPEHSCSVSRPTTGSGFSLLAVP